MVKIVQTDLTKGLANFGPSAAPINGKKWVFVPKQALEGKKAEDKKEIMKWYTGQDITNDSSQKKKTVQVQNLPKLKKGLTPGKVCIILAGRFQGKRVVFLKQMPKSGLLLVSGPYEVNGVPLRRVPQSYVIVTSVSIDVFGVKLPSEVTQDSYFTKLTSSETSKKLELQRYRKSEEMFFKQGEKVEIDEAAMAKKKEVQKKVDAEIVKAIAKTPLLEKYLKDLFSLRSTDVAHRMKF